MTVALWYYQYAAANVELIETGNLHNEIALAAQRGAELQADIHGLYIVGYQIDTGFVYEDDWPLFHDKLDEQIRRRAPAPYRGRVRTTAVPWHTNDNSIDVCDIPTHWPDWIGAPLP